MKAIWKDTVLAESEDTVVVEGNHYFPRESVNREYFEDSEHRTTCPWKGVASYYHVMIGGKQNANAAWYYPDPTSEAAHIKDHVAFWKDVEIA